MNKEQLKTIISSILENAPEQVRNPIGRGRYDPPYIPGKDFGNICTLLEYLESNQSIVDVFDNKKFNGGRVAYILTIELLADWLLCESLYSGIDSAIDKLDTYLKSDSTPCDEVLAISGITIDEEINISSNVKIVQYESLPDSIEKDQIHPPEMRKPHMGSPYYNFPKVAIVRRVGLSPKSYQNDPKIFHYQNFQYLLDLCDFMALLNIGTPTPAGIWCIIPDTVPCQSFKLGSSTGDFQSELFSFTSQKLTQENWNSVQHIFDKFIELPQEVKDKLRVPLQRINQAKRRESIVEKALDLGIAYESLLLSDKGHNEQLSFTLRLRAALFLGETIEERKHLMSFFTAFYGCRSKAAHTGTLEQTTKIPNQREKVPTHIVLNNSIEHCLCMIKRIIELGRFPNWDDLILGDSQPNDPLS